MKVKDYLERADTEMKVEKEDAVVEKIKEHKRIIESAEKVLKRAKSKLNKFLESDIEDLDLEEMEY